MIYFYKKIFFFLLKILIFAYFGRKHLEGNERDRSPSLLQKGG